MLSLGLGLGITKMQGGTTPPNLLTKTEQFDHDDWSKLNGATITADNVTDPDGGATADTLNYVSATSERLQRVVPISAGPKTFSVWVKQGASHQGTQSRIQLIGTGEDEEFFVAPAAWERKIFTLGSGDVATSVTIRIYSSVPDPGGAHGIALWGAQLVESENAGAYQKVA